jgi:GNAT superfamily N-acetyltransferase
MRIIRWDESDASVVKETWYAAGPGVAGYYRLHLPEKENLDSAFLTLTVHPAHRRQGIGTELLRHAAGRAAARGRSVLAGQTLQATAGDAFAKAAGARAGVTAPRWLAVAEPGLRMIETVNAAGNDHMISINEQLGFQVAHPWWQLYDIPVASVVT